MTFLRTFAFLGIVGFLMPMAANAAYVLEIDTDGMDDGVLTYHPNFSFGGDTTTASQSAPSNAPGMNGGDSIFGGDGTAIPDTYVATYTPSVDADNFFPATGTNLGDGNFAFGLPGGGTAGEYAVYATWPATDNVSGGDTLYDFSDAGGTIFQNTINQNGAATNDGIFFGNVWVLLGTASLTPGVTYTLTQQPTEANSFVSMRAAGYLFEKIPEPSSILLLAMALAGGALASRRR